MKGNVNTEGVEEGGTFPKIPEAVYVVQITEVRDGKSSNNDPMATVQFTITEGEYASQWIWENVVISDNPESPGYKILGRTKHFLHIIGQEYEGQIEYDTDAWLNQILRIEIYHDKNYKDKPKVKKHLFLTDEEEEAGERAEDLSKPVNKEKVPF